MFRCCASGLSGLALLALSGGGAQSAGSATVSGNVGGWVASATRVGTAPDSRQVTIAAYMAVKDLPALKKLADDVSTPGSAQYGRYVSNKVLAARFAPDAADVNAARAMLSAAGMSNIHVGPGGAYISADATVAQIRATFGVTQDLYQFGKQTLRANKEAPSIPAALNGKILYIEGLDDTSLLKHPLHVSATLGDLVAPMAARTSGTKPAVTPPPVASNLPSPYCDQYAGDLQATLSTAPSPYPAKLPWLGCGYTPQQIQQAYGMNKVAVDGSGVRIGIVDAYASPTLMADGNSYAKKHGLPPLTSANFSQDIPAGIYDVDPGESCGPYGWWGEESLDLAAVHGSAPGASIVYIGARDCGTSLTVAFVNAVLNDEADILTNSYSYGGESLDPAYVAFQDQTFLLAAAEGITVLFSSGDDGDLSQTNGVASGSYEATSSYATGVGGTSLGLVNSAGTKVEYGWGTYRDFLAGAQVNSGTSITTSGLETATAFGFTYDAFSFYSGSGGGISLIEPQPAYQAPVVPYALATTLYSASYYSVTLPEPQRVSPDVAMDADPYTGYLIGETFTISSNSTDNIGCTKTSSTTEYCEIPYGGTSLASPLMAGVLARVNQARGSSGRPFVGFANPWLYANKIGSTFTSSGINDVTPPKTPTAVLRGYVTNPQEVRVVTLNSAPFGIVTAPFALFYCDIDICEGLDDVFNAVTPGYDNVTGLGVPYLPKLITQ